MAKANNEEVIQMWAQAVWDTRVSAEMRDKVLDALISPSHQDGRDMVKASWTRLHETFAGGVSAKVEEQRSQGNKVLTRFHISAQTKDGKSTEWTAVYIHRLEGGLIVDSSCFP